MKPYGSKRVYGKGGFTRTYKPIGGGHIVVKTGVKSKKFGRRLTRIPISEETPMVF